MLISFPTLRLLLLGEYRKKLYYSKKIDYPPSFNELFEGYRALRSIGWDVDGRIRLMKTFYGSIYCKFRVEFVDFNKSPYLQYKEYVSTVDEFMQFKFAKPKFFYEVDQYVYDKYIDAIENNNLLTLYKSNYVIKV